VIETSATLLTVRVVDAEVEPDARKWWNFRSSLIAETLAPDAIADAATEPFDSPTGLEPVMSLRVPSEENSGRRKLFS